MSRVFSWLQEQSVQGLITGKQIKRFCREQAAVVLNLPLPTMGGEIWWDSVEVDGWKIQQHKLTGHCRILDPKGVRQAYGSEEQFASMFPRYLQEQQRIAQVADKRYGIVFSGGGGKGAYQIGVWKYLCELGLDQKITGVSGASVGALNSLLFAQEDWELARHTWMRIRQEDMFVLDLIKRGLFSMDKLDDIIQRTPLDWSRVLGSDKLIYTVLSRVCLPHPPSTKIRGLGDLWKPLSRAEYRCWAGADPRDVREIVLASASLPIVYGEREAVGELYLDGGVQDNLPVRPLVKAGYRDIIVIHLLRKTNERARTEWKRAVKGLDCSGTAFHHVYPGEEFDDSLEATLTVNPKLTKQRIALGYQDARAQLGALAERM